MSYLAVNYGFSVRWTDYLDEHLEINWERRIVWIFQHKVWLAAQINSKTDSLLPLEVAEEALDTLNSLFPHHHAPTTSFMARHGQEFHRLGSFNRKPRTEVSDFKYWGGKIEQLMGELSKPRRGLRQLRPDKRNVLNPVNFWVAAGLACLAFLSSIAFGAVSVFYAKRSLEVSEQSLELSRLQYLLSVAQACSTPEGAQSLPEFCSD
ncbi:hypothetical protein CKAH01_17958 [Colletotrichum kahawae]|uniref:Uncharacterized protein n=1 Tax=Colletotrichum kahawae TaxID=34407 RepID=A0AAE0D5G8_COLKA|nr:hypothetical protein CKAH01_17958 [Colletotrichum kahawae]